MITKRKDRDLLARELSEARRRVEQLEHARIIGAAQDPLTRLFNHAGALDRLATELRHVRHQGRSLTAALIDVDGFTTINVAHGSGAGNEALLAVTRALERCTHGRDVLGRLGSDEFVAILPDTNIAGAVRCCERVLLELEATSTAVLASVSVSIGLAAFERGQRPEQLLGSAREALLRARAAGGGRIEVACEQPPAGDGAQREAVAGLAVALSERDRYTGEHSETVVEMAATVASRLALPADEIERVRAAALLHDIGKVAIPDDILHKDGPLDDDQWLLMREHPVIGERILRAIPGLGGVARIVRHEHERWDGGGYPDGLAGSDIPIGSRIILACDAYHAMTSDRPYRKAQSHAEAIEELSRGAGVQFDPEVVGVLIGYLYGLRQSGVRHAA